MEASFFTFQTLLLRSKIIKQKHYGRLCLEDNKWIWTYILVTYPPPPIIFREAYSVLYNFSINMKLNGNYTRMLRAILNKSWRQHPTRHQLYGHLPPITKTIQARRTRHAGHCWKSSGRAHKLCTPIDRHIWPSKSNDQLQLTYRSYVRIRDVALKTCQKRWTIGRSGERGSGISLPAARHDEDDDLIHMLFNSALKKFVNLPIFPWKVGFDISIVKA